MKDNRSKENNINKLFSCVPFILTRYSTGFHLNCYGKAQQNNFNSNKIEINIDKWHRMINDTDQIITC